MTAAFYNAFFTSLPIGAFAMFDRPVRRLATLMAAPQAYNRKPPLTTRAFWKTGVLTAIVHASVGILNSNPACLHIYNLECLGRVLGLDLWVWLLKQDGGLAAPQA